MRKMAFIVIVFVIIFPNLAHSQENKGVLEDISKKLDLIYMKNIELIAEIEKLESEIKYSKPPFFYDANKFPGNIRQCDTKNGCKDTAKEMCDQIGYDTIRTFDSYNVNETWYVSYVLCTEVEDR